MSKKGRGTKEKTTEDDLYMRGPHKEGKGGSLHLKEKKN